MLRNRTTDTDWADLLPGVSRERARQVEKYPGNVTIKESVRSLAFWSELTPHQRRENCPSLIPGIENIEAT